VSAALSPLIAATSQWLMLAYPSAGTALDSALAEVQARQAVTVAAWLRHPTAIDAELAVMAGPGGSGRLDRLTGLEIMEPADEAEWLGHAWRTWVDEVVASWATCLLTDPDLAEGARLPSAARTGRAGRPGGGPAPPPGPGLTGRRPAPGGAAGTPGAGRAAHGVAAALCARTACAGPCARAQPTWRAGVAFAGETTGVGPGVAGTRSGASSDCSTVVSSVP
jgi:hypothetical protein